MCLVCWEKPQRRDPHRVSRGGILGPKKGPKRAILGHKRYLVLLAPNFLHHRTGYLHRQSGNNCTLQTVTCFSEFLAKQPAPADFDTCKLHCFDTCKLHCCLPPIPTPPTPSECSPPKPTPLWDLETTWLPLGDAAFKVSERLAIRSRRRGSEGSGAGGVGPAGGSL